MAREPTAAFACFLCAAESGDADGHNMLGRCFENGWGTAKGLRRKPCVIIASPAEAGSDWAQYNLGHMLLSGSGVARDRDAAFLAMPRPRQGPCPRHEPGGPLLRGRLGRGA